MLWELPLLPDNQRHWEGRLREDPWNPRQLPHQPSVFISKHWTRGTTTATDHLRGELRGDSTEWEEGHAGHLAICSTLELARELGLGEQEKSFVLQYFDDFTAIQTLSIKSGISHITTSKERRDVHANFLQKTFDTVRRNAKVIGMQIHPGKTKILCISAAKHSHIDAHILVDGLFRNQAPWDCNLELTKPVGQCPPSQAWLVCYTTGQACWMIYNSL